MKHTFKMQERMFDIIIYITYLLIIISSTGISINAPKYLTYLNYYMRIYVCLFLIWRFNPLRKRRKFKQLDCKIAFSAGMIILTSTILQDYMNIIINSVLMQHNNK